MKKNLVMRIAAVVLMCTLVTACFASSTFAKYTSQATGKASVTVAKWDIDFRENATSFESGATFDLFATINDTHAGNINTSNDDIADKVIAPGSEGSFSFGIENKSEVTASYVVEFTLSKALPGFTFKVGETTISPADDGVTYTIPRTDVAIGGTVDKTVTWAWDYGNDRDDTSLAGSKITVDVTIVATQVD